jgi:hypothetical protein
MTTDSVSALSTFPHRLYRDIRLSNDIGRDSPMDPFKTKDLTLLFSKKKDTSRSLMYFAQKPLRRPHGAVVMGKQPDPRKGMGIYREITQASYEVSYPMDPHIAVSFTKGRRFPDPMARNRHLEERRQVLLSRKVGGDHSPIELALDPAPEDAPGPYLKSVIEPLDDSHVPKFDLYAGRKWDISPERRSPRRDRFTVFPWERRGRKSVSRNANRPATQPSGNASPTSQTGGGKVDDDDTKSSVADRELARSRAQSVAQQSVATGNGGPGSRKARDTNEQQDEEQWLKERKQLLTRYGLSGGAAATRRERLKRRLKPKGTDIGANTGRDAPVCGMAYGKELHDLTYNPKYDVTTMERKKLADVKLDKYASRQEDGLPAHIATVNAVLDYSRLTKFHQMKLKQERESALALPNANNNTSQHQERPLTAADDYATNPRTGYAPRTVVTRIWKGAPDMSLFSDRPDEPLAAVLGGDMRRYRKLLRQEEKEEEKKKSRNLSSATPMTTAGSPLEFGNGNSSF